MSSAKKIERYIQEYEDNGEIYYQVYVCKVSKRIKGLKAQKRVKAIATVEEARKIRDRWNDRLIEKLLEKESLGYTWGEVVEKWERYWKDNETRTFNEDTLADHLARVNNWVDDWAEKPINELKIKDARDLVKKAQMNGASIQLRSMIKRTVNIIIKWAVEEGYVTKYQLSPAKNIEILMRNESRSDAKKPEILTWFEIHKLMKMAKDQDHTWFPIWFMGLHSGMRSGELEALAKENVQLVPLDVAKKLDLLRDGDPRKSYGKILVQWAWKQKQKCYGPTKAHYWREVPVNQEMYYFLLPYLEIDNGVNRYPDGKDENGNDKFIELQRFFPQVPYWRRGQQASVLRLFCESSKLKSIKFHTLRACFATQLLGMGVGEEQVRKIGGWKDVDTMRIYVRAAGILESGATQGLKFLESKDEFDINSPYNNVEYVSAADLDGIHKKSESTLKKVSGDAMSCDENVLEISSFRKQ